MDQPIINESSFSTANPSSYSLTEIWPFNEGGLGLKIGGGFVGDSGESSVTEQSGNGGRKTTNNSEEDETSLLVSNTSHDLSNLNGKRMKISGSKDELSGLKVDGEGSSGSGSKAVAAEQSSKQSEPPKDYIHVRARRGQATDSHSLAERARREKISERMKILQDLVPGCNKGIGKVLIVDQIINYTQSLQHQVEFLSMKLEAVNTRMSSPIEGFPTKESNLNGKRMKISGLKDELSGLGVNGEGSSGSGSKVAAAEQSSKQTESPKDYIHVRARRNQATDSPSLAEKARREKINARMKILQDLVPGCNKGIGKVLMLDEVINYIQSLQHQVEFLSMKLEAGNTRMSSPIEGFPTKEDGCFCFILNASIYIGSLLQRVFQA